MTETTTTTADEQQDQALEMSVSVEKLSDIERKVAVEIPWDQVLGRLDEAYKELGHGVTIKGFRKGKVPRKMLERMFGKHVNKEVAQRLVQDSITKALTDHDIAPVSEPQIDDGEIVEGAAFCYSAVLQVVPEIEPRDYFGVEVKQRPAHVNDEDVESALASKQRENTEYIPVEGRKTQAGDVLLVDVMGKQGDQPLSFEQETVELGDSPREALAGLAAKLTDIAPDTEDLELELDLPVAGEEGKTETARLLVTIHDVKEKKVPELDDEFAKDTGEAETLDGLKEVLRGRLLEADEDKAKEEAKGTLLKNLVDLNDVPTVPALVERHLDRTIKLQLAMMGIDPNMPGIDREALKDQARADAEDTVKQMMLLQAISKKENVEFDEADLEKRLAEIASSRGQNVARVRSEYENEGRMEALRTQLREEKTLDLLMAKAKISIEEIVEIAEETDTSTESTEEATEAPVQAPASDDNTDGAESQG